MNDNREPETSAGPAYARAQLARAFATALAHPDPATRERAETRAGLWQDVLDAILGGRVTVGSRTPVADLPAWVTPEVVRGGFATSRAAAEGPLEQYERRAAEEAGVPARREALFAHWLTEPGLERLWALLDSGRYETAVPEEGALLTVAWLVRAGEHDAAVELARELEPFADRLRFTPRPATGPAPDSRAVHRSTAGEAGAALVARRPHDGVEAQREAHTVWLPFGDELLAHWLAAGDLDGVPDEAWLARGTALLARYAKLAANHDRCTKHLNPKENLGILRGALEEVVAGRALDARRRGLVRCATRAMVRKRGLPGSDRHRELRAGQRAQAALPSHLEIGQLVRRRLDALPQTTGVAEVPPLLVDVSEAEAEGTSVPAGTALPKSLRRVLERTLSAPVDVLVARGLVPSAEVLATLVPQLVGTAFSGAYPDGALRTLGAAHYRAFRTRRSLLLLDHASQVRIGELPWVRALEPHRTEAGRAPARVALRHTAELAVGVFPGTPLPNPLVRELGVLARESGDELPFTEDLAADIFMGSFTPKFARAARIAAEVLAGSLYARYYGIDYSAAWTPEDFGALCTERAGAAGRRDRSPAVNGTIIEQAQILTTHNLATLVARAEIRPEAGWADLARGAFGTVCRFTARLENNPRPLTTVKAAAYAWRQMLFFLSLCDDAARAQVLAGLGDHCAQHPRPVARRLAPALAGLSAVEAGGRAGDGQGELFLGWTTRRHWILAAR
ncbi:hypothetical protein SRB5_07640 [Streptomyces sp. RB5]|uniref:Uncharacterized protein n=1 Tax=Streptomyces smaragdinus TaxID=2585196 RepID=A0A7K0CBA4_9ACTN|nr:hypothetical protein [Streptomyces smaragdinus]MQY10653.1 hypothetical protein [Streptomyces smaragdinus]